MVRSGRVGDGGRTRTVRSDGRRRSSAPESLAVGGLIRTRRRPLRLTVEAVPAGHEEVANELTMDPGNYRMCPGELSYLPDTSRLPCSLCTTRSSVSTTRNCVTGLGYKSQPPETGIGFPPRYTTVGPSSTRCVSLSFCTNNTTTYDRKFGAITVVPGAGRQCINGSWRESSELPRPTLRFADSLRAGFPAFSTGFAETAGCTRWFPQRSKSPPALDSAYPLPTGVVPSN